jgi:hypothetical protein
MSGASVEWVVMNTYKLRLIHTIADAKGYFSIIWKDYELPFVPWVGLSIADWNAGFNGGGLEIKTLLWSTTLGSFVGQTSGDKWGNQQNSKEVTKEVDARREEYLRSMLADGWSDTDLDE